MTHDEIAELLGAYALDAVDPHEHRVVEAHLATCPRCRAEVEQHRETAATLAHSGGAAPEGLWDQIASRLEAAPPSLELVPRGASTSPTARRRSPWARWPALVGAAAAAVLVVALGLQVRAQDQRIDDLQAALDDPLVPALQAAIEDPGSDLVELTSEDGEVVVLAAITERGTGYLRASPLPELDDDRTYQLWGITGDEVISLGVLGREPGVVAFPGGGYDAFAITEERWPGVVASEQPPVVAGAAA